VLEAVAGYTAHHKGYLSGKAEVQALFDKYRADQAELALRAQVDKQSKEAAMQAQNQKVTENYESLKDATRLAVGALDADRMRLQAALAAYRHSTPGDPGAGLPADASPADGILAQCIDRYAAVAGSADQLADQVVALQSYVRTVCHQ
jgi:hypothetical protein